MYFPYLYGRRSELLALRDFSVDYPEDRNVFPLVEPVKSNPEGLVRAINVLSRNNVMLVVILNPSQSELSNQESRSTWYSGLTNAVDPAEDFIPALLCDGRVSYADINSFLTQFSTGSSVLVYNSPELTSEEVFGLNQDPRVGLQVVKEGGLDPVIRANLSAKKTVDILDCFNSQPRNADYNGPEFFSRQHLVFQQSSCGYGDFTVLPTVLPGSGGKPGAVVVHATFKEEESGEVWIDHYVSIETDRSVGEVEDKFFDAAGQLCQEVGGRPLEFGMNPAIAKYQLQVKNYRFPGLPDNKRQQILHHICLNRQILMGEL